jgi:hypothetical protein
MTLVARKKPAASRLQVSKITGRLFGFCGNFDLLRREVDQLFAIYRYKVERKDCRQFALSAVSACAAILLYAIVCGWRQNSLHE